MYGICVPEEFQLLPFSQNGKHNASWHLAFTSRCLLTFHILHKLLGQLKGMENLLHVFILFKGIDQF